MVVPKPDFGNRNDGNTSRRLFADPGLSASITGLDASLIYLLRSFKKHQQLSEEAAINISIPTGWSIRKKFQLRYTTWISLGIFTNGFKEHSTKEIITVSSRNFKPIER